MISKEIFTVYHCKACNKIEVSQYITKEQMEELGLTEEELKPICPFTGSSDLEELYRCGGGKKISEGKRKSGAKAVAYVTGFPFLS